MFLLACSCIASLFCAQYGLQPNGITSVCGRLFVRLCLELSRFFVESISNDSHTMLLADAGQVKAMFVRTARQQRKLRHQQHNDVCDGGHGRGTDVTASDRQSTAMTRRNQCHGKHPSEQRDAEMMSR